MNSLPGFVNRFIGFEENKEAVFNRHLGCLIETGRFNIDLVVAFRYIGNRQLDCAFPADGLCYGVNRLPVTQ